MRKYVFISDQAATWTLTNLCRVLGVSRSGYYQWQAASPPPAPTWQPAAQQAFTRQAARYGTRRLRAELRAEGYQVGRYALGSWLRASRQRALRPRPQGPRTTLASYARPGNPYGNAQSEAGWSTLKTELLPHGGAFANLEQARLEVAYYLDTYFNLDRRHAALGYRSPHQFEADLLNHLP